jgi:hypothetical protein
MLGFLQLGVRVARGSIGIAGHAVKVSCLGVLTGVMLIVGLGSAAPSALAASTLTVDLGQASSYAVLSGASVGNTVNAAGAPFTTLRGDLGVLANTQPTGFPPGIVTGTTRVGTTVTPAYTDLIAAYNDVAGRTGGAALAGDLAGLTLAPGLHSSAAAVSNTGTVTLDGAGNPNAVFVFQVGGALTMAAGAQIKLTDGAQASNVFWQVNGAAAIGAGDTFAGTLMAHDAVAIGAGTEVNGRALALTGAISLDSNEFYSAPPVVTVDGGATANTNASTPTITGTTDLASPGVVSVTIAGQTLTATPSDGTWSVTSALLADGTYPIRASATDGAGNTASATEQLTIDTVPPVIAIVGGTSLTTNDPTRSISGTTNAAPGTLVQVSVYSQTLTALVQAGETWNVAPTALPDGTYTLTASVTDPAGNVGTASQAMTLDTVAPAVSITDGAIALTNDPTPNISGTADVVPGTPVIVTLADQTLTTLVQDSGVWSVTAGSLSNGPHRVVMSVTDAAGNQASTTQTLTVDTIAPVLAINGGASASTTNTDPTIAGTSNATPGTTITVSIAGQTMTTLLQANGTWNATPTTIGAGTWPVVASATDPAGNLGTAKQTLTITTPTNTSGGGQTGGSGSTGAGSRLVMWLSATRYRIARGKRVQVPFILSAPGKVTLTVLRGTKVVAILSTTRRNAGRGTLTWNGKIKRKLAPTGTYKITVRAVSPDGASTRDTATLHIT